MFSLFGRKKTGRTLYKNINKMLVLPDNLVAYQTGPNLIEICDTQTKIPHSTIKTDQEITALAVLEDGRLAIVTKDEICLREVSNNNQSEKKSAMSHKTPILFEIEDIVSLPHNQLAYINKIGHVKILDDSFHELHTTHFCPPKGNRPTLEEVKFGLCYLGNGKLAVKGSASFNEVYCEVLDCTSLKALPNKITKTLSELKEIEEDPLGIYSENSAGFLSQFDSTMTILATQIPEQFLLCAENSVLLADTTSGPLGFITRNERDNATSYCVLPDNLMASGHKSGKIIFWGIEVEPSKSSESKSDVTIPTKEKNPILSLAVTRNHELIYRTKDGIGSIDLKKRYEEYLKEVNKFVTGNPHGPASIVTGYLGMSLPEAKEPRKPR